MLTSNKAWSASGKVILVGEHAVVYGVPAIAVGIDRGAKATLLRVPGPHNVLRVRSWGIEVSDNEPDSDLARAFRSLLAASAPHVAQCEAESGMRICIETETDLPPGGGLGCSAALGVSSARALDPSASDEQIAARAMAWERVFHGNPSGIDAAVSAHGGSVLFRKTRGLESIRLRTGLNLCVGHTGKMASTRAMVERVSLLRSANPDVTETAFGEIGELVDSAKHALETGDRLSLGAALDRNQEILAGLGVSTPEIDTLCDLARGAGASGAKLTGAGGGGSVVALVSSVSAADDVLARWNTFGFKGFFCRVVAPSSPHQHVTELST